MYRVESWSKKKADPQRIDGFKLWCWRRLLRLPWTARRSNQSILKKINPEYSLEALILKLKLQYFGDLMKSQLTRKEPDAQKDWGPKEKKMTEDQMVGWHHRLKGHEFEQTPWDIEGREAWHTTVHGIAKSQTWLSDWRTTTRIIYLIGTDSNEFLSMAEYYSIICR